MTTPLPEIGEAEAQGRVAAIYADIRETQKLGLVNLIWRHLATKPDALEWTWNRLRPVYASGVAAREAVALAESLLLPKLAPVPRAAMSLLGLTEKDRVAVLSLLQTYNRGNGLNLIALSALSAVPRSSAGDTAGNPAPLTDPPPPMPALDTLAPEVQTLILEINRFGTRGAKTRVIASLYRHLGLWPGYLAFAWAQLAPSAIDGTLDEAVDGLREAARPYAQRAATAIDTSVTASSPETQRFAEHAIEYFLATAITRMVPIGLMLSRSLAPRG